MVATVFLLFRVCAKGHYANMPKRSKAKGTSELSQTIGLIAQEKNKNPCIEVVTEESFSSCPHKTFHFGMLMLVF